MINTERLINIFYNVANFPFRTGEDISPSIRQCIDNSALALSAGGAVFCSSQGSGAAIMGAVGGYVFGHALVGLAFRPFIK